MAVALIVFGSAGALAADATAPDPAAALSKIVARLSAQDRCSAIDWAELSQESVSWGQHLKSAGQAVPEGPVRDALRAVDIGAALDPKVADWPRVRSELEDLLKKPDEKEKRQQQQNQDQQKNQDQQQDKKQDQKQQQSQDQKEQQQQPGSQDESRNSSSQQQQRPQESKGTEKPSAFGDMARPTPTPPGAKEPGEAMQRVGGVRKDQPRDPALDKPELAVPLEKLEQVKNQDSPAELFEMLRRGEPIPTPTNTGKNW